MEISHVLRGKVSWSAFTLYIAPARTEINEYWVVTPTSWWFATSMEMYGAQIWSVVCWRLEAQTKQCCKKSIVLLYWCLLVQALLRYCLWFSVATDKFSTQYIRPSLLPTNERGWMGVTTQYSCISVRAGAMYSACISSISDFSICLSLLSPSLSFLRPSPLSFLPCPSLPSGVVTINW